MSRVFNAFMNMVEEFKDENPDLVDRNDSSEETVSFHRDFENFLDSQDKVDVDAMSKDLDK